VKDSHTLGGAGERDFTCFTPHYSVQILTLEDKSTNTDPHAIGFGGEQHEDAQQELEKLGRQVEASALMAGDQSAQSAP